MATFSADWGNPNTSLNAAPAAVAGDSFGLVRGRQRSGRLTWLKDVGGTGSFSALQVDMEGSLDNVNWFQIDTSSTTADSQASLQLEGWLYVRANLISRTIGSLAPTVTVKFVVT